MNSINSNSNINTSDDEAVLVQKGGQQQQQQQQQEQEQEPEPEPCETFDVMGLKEDLLRGIFAQGFETPSVVQQRAVPAMLTGRDVVAQAQSGTGKTATFSIGILQLVDTSLRRTQAVVLAPTRELAEQSYKVCTAIGTYMGVTTRVCVGGRAVRLDRDALRGNPHVVIGTPGRILHMMQERTLSVRDVRLLVVDEADEMLEQGFQEQLQQVMGVLPEEAQVCLFSATMPSDTLDITRRFMRADAITILIANKGELTLEGIAQYAVLVDGDGHKLDAVCDLYENITVSQAIFFANRRSTVDWLAHNLNERDFTVSAIHSEMEQEERDARLDAFRNGSSRVLIATDILGRGIDVQGVSLVINFELPTVRENYIHRIGRTGRFGRKGIAINLLSRRDEQLMADIMRFYQCEVMELPADLASLSA